MIALVWFEAFMIAAEIPFFFLLKAKKVKTLIIISMITYTFPILIGFLLEWGVRFYLNRG